MLSYATKTFNMKPEWPHINVLNKYCILVPHSLMTLKICRMLWCV